MRIAHCALRCLSELRANDAIRRAYNNVSAVPMLTMQCILTCSFTNISPQNEFRSRTTTHTNLLRVRARCGPMSPAVQSDDPFHFGAVIMNEKRTHQQPKHLSSELCYKYACIWVQSAQSQVCLFVVIRVYVCLAGCSSAVCALPFIIRTYTLMDIICNIVYQFSIECSPTKPHTHKKPQHHHHCALELTASV